MHQKKMDVQLTVPTMNRFLFAMSQEISRNCLTRPLSLYSLDLTIQDSSQKVTMAQRKTRPNKTRRVKHKQGNISVILKSTRNSPEQPEHSNIASATLKNEANCTVMFEYGCRLELVGKAPIMYGFIKYLKKMYISFYTTILHLQ